MSAPVNLGIGSWIERRARIAPDRVALIGGDRSLTYAELARRVRRLANGLRRLGVAPGDRVAWVGPNHPAFLESLFATGLLGAALAPVNHRLEPDEVRWVLDDVEPAVLIGHGAIDAGAVPSSVGQRVAVAGPADGWIDYETLPARSTDDPVQVAVEMDDLCLLPHTSGTTGWPKGIMLTHANVTWNVVNFLSCADFRNDDVTVAIAPFFRIGGTGVNVLPILFLGGTVIVPDDVSADEVLGLIERHRVSVGFGNPDTLNGLARSESWPRTDLSSVRFIVTGGAPVPERLIHTYLDRGVTLLQGYGLSEAAPLALLLDPESALEKIGSAGRPPLLVDVRIAGPDGIDVRTGDTGELLVRGPNVMSGYWNDPEATSAALTPDGWLRTGDAARSDDEGYVWIVDRVADGFLSDGRVVHPGDVERVLLGHPSIADVGVTSFNSAGRGMVTVAFVVLVAGADDTEQDIVAFGRHHLAPHQSPTAVTFVDHVPRSSVGKLMRDELRAMTSPGPTP
jgi:acyl-CoA synthetase (AMP-forming)/AMP-acid ligase II